MRSGQEDSDEVAVNGLDPRAWAGPGLALVLLQVTGGLCLASEFDLRIGAMEFSPYAEVSTTYDDNPFELAKSQEPDLFETLTGGVKVKYPFKSEDQINFDWESKIHQYHHSSYSEMDWNDEHLGGGDLRLENDRGFVDVRQRFAVLEDTEGTLVAMRLRRWLSDTGAVVGVHFKPLDVSLDYTCQLRRWFKEQYHDQDYMAHVAGTRVDFKTFETLKPYLRYEFQRTNFDGKWAPALGLQRSNDQVQHQAMAGVSHALSDQIGWDASASVQHTSLIGRNLDASPYLGQRESDQLMLPKSEVWQPKYDLRSNPYLSQPESNQTTASASAHWRPSSGVLELRLYCDRTTQSAAAAETLEGGVQVSRKWGERLVTQASASCAHYNQRGPGDFWYVVGSASVVYRMSKLASVTCRYEHRDKTATEGAGSFKRNATMIGGVFAW